MKTLMRQYRKSLAVTTALAAAVTLGGLGVATMASADDPAPTYDGWMGFEGTSITANVIAQTLMGDSASLTNAVTALATQETQALLDGTGASLAATFSTIYNILSDAITNGLNVSNVASELLNVVGQVASDTVGDPSTFASDFADPGSAPDPIPAPDPPADLPTDLLPDPSVAPSVTHLSPGAGDARVEDVALSPLKSSGVVSAAFVAPASVPSGSAAQMTRGEPKAYGLFVWSLHGVRNTKIYYGHPTASGGEVTDGFFYDDYYANTYYSSSLDLIGDLQSSAVHFHNVRYDLRRDNNNWWDDEMHQFPCAGDGYYLECTGAATIPNNDGKWYFVRQDFDGTWGSHGAHWEIQTRRAQSRFGGNQFVIAQYGG